MTCITSSCWCIFQAGRVLGSKWSARVRSTYGVDTGPLLTYSFFFVRVADVFFFGWRENGRRAQDCARFRGKSKVTREYSQIWLVFAGNGGAELYVCVPPLLRVVRGRVKHCSGELPPRHAHVFALVGNAEWFQGGVRACSSHRI